MSEAVLEVDRNGAGGDRLRFRLWGLACEEALALRPGMPGAAPAQAAGRLEAIRDRLRTAGEPPEALEALADMVLRWRLWPLGYAGWERDYRWLAEREAAHRPRR